MAKNKLMAHQKAGVKFLDSVDGVGALLWDPGVGKTYATLAWIDKLAKRQGEVRVLVVAPLTAADTWVLQPPGIMKSVVKARMLQGPTLKILGMIRSSAKWTEVPDTPIKVNHAGPKHDRRVTILSMSAGAISNFCRDRNQAAKMLRAIRAYDPHVIVLDESHIAKAPESVISKTMYQIGQLAPHRIALTGTVQPHGPLDVFGQWRFLAPWTFSDDYGKKFTKKPTKMSRLQVKAIRPWPWSRFKDRYTVPGGYKGKGIGGYQNLKDLRDRVAERSMVVRKEDALDLPPVTDIDIHVTLTAQERKAYNDMHDELAALLDDGELIEAPNALAKIMKLRQIAAGFVRNTETDQVHVVGTSLQKAVTEIVNVQLAGEDRIVVFAYFKAEVAALAKALKRKGRVVEVVTGDTKPKDRLAIRKRFGDVSRNPTPMVLVAQARTMSLSVNELVSAQHAVYASLSERRDDWVQSRDRLNRKGQTKPVTFWNCYVPGTVGEIMLDKHKERGDLEKALLDHVKSKHRL